MAWFGPVGSWGWVVLLVSPFMRASDHYHDDDEAVRKDRLGYVVRNLGLNLHC